jgi:hypothetical protein
MPYNFSPRPYFPILIFFNSPIQCGFFIYIETIFGKLFLFTVFMLLLLLENNAEEQKKTFSIAP